MENKNVLITCDDLSLLGGSVITAIRMANALVDRGWNVVMFTCNSNTIEPLDPRIKIEFATWYFFIGLGNNVGKVGGLSFARARKVIKKYDIGVVLSTNMGILGAGVGIVAHSFGIKVLSLCSGQVENALAGLPRIFNNRLFIKFIEFSMRIYYKNVDFVIPQSEFSKRLLLEIGIRLPSEIVSNGVDLNIYKKEDDQLLLAYIKRKYSIDTENFFNIAFLGRLSKEKSVETLIYATKQLVDKGKKINVFLIGNGTEKDYLVNLTRDLSLLNHVKLLGHIPTIDLIGVLSLCNIYVHPSEIELEGMALLEAMACGLPIIVSDSKLSASSQFVNTNGELFENKNSLDLSNKLLRYVENPDLLKNLSAASLETAKQYSFDQNMNKLSKLLADNLPAFVNNP